jgi:hypothetical protein
MAINQEMSEGTEGDWHQDFGDSARVFNCLVPCHAFMGADDVYYVHLGEIVSKRDISTRQRCGISYASHSLHPHLPDPRSAVSSFSLPSSPC